MDDRSVEESGDLFRSGYSKLAEMAPQLARAGPFSRQVERGLAVLVAAKAHVDLKRRRPVLRQRGLHPILDGPCGRGSAEQQGRRGEQDRGGGSACHMRP
jgi:hypothetical protein